MVKKKLPAHILKTVNEFKKTLQASGMTVDFLIVFGSYAKGLARADSDIDVGVVSKMFGKDDVVEMQELFKKASRVNTFIEPYPLNPKDLKDTYNPIIQEILNTGVAVY
ncbi:MAG: hypothetical protein A3C50_00350 [Candidatus Staskawiczbacteria bacterium RIFCSPHIGHO2_02_FULL_43_16]|uniref:Polymerase beta nucleotidyltransferase domain-containing protein n=1 Tax=Candidatus Staskawiczbacteria bacterium RIFCSPHIGHO2_01_FULL_41_41 TaxID=1802203 RepID=A0A1G2HW99_9BACT|nr:MAG: hypothetical protein A2822_02015 [Candidatus Staskawiczbacteria bacterium RIFCSPHIGHO2_01_FULL_41_41]OGZ68935.1 MAG: hypothetical protein A3C50_00350 [Candidatus Staskawiczbacteria bacterium RIFCSPHIGHO2_02_FULL_43_16]OGZ74883.1 MAG: hypothetical protein A3A12_03465 [Candidatus Staskawiczbacteria bacterium RIFCSPLOWO2_01_FULL_43_17b]